MQDPSRNRSFLLAVVVTLFAVVTTPLSAQEGNSNDQESTGVLSAIAPVDWDAIRQSAERYAAAYNAGDAAAIAQLFAENSELVDAEGNVFQGRAAIQREYSAFFKSHPDTTIRIAVDNVRSVAPGIITEDGQTATTFGDNTPPITSRYMAVHAKEGESWRLVSVRDSDSPVNDPGAKLEQLAWLIGQWIDEDAESLLEIDCYWHESGVYLIRDFQVRVKGLLAASGSERIGWDPLRQQIRSWLFDCEGGYLEGDWVRDGDKWTIVAKGFRADGKPSQATYVVTPLKKDAYHMASFNRFAGEAQLEDLDMTVVRRPPEPKSGVDNGLKEDANSEK